MESKLAQCFSSFRATRWCFWSAGRSRTLNFLSSKVRWFKMLFCWIAPCSSIHSYSYPDSCLPGSSWLSWTSDGGKSTSESCTFFATSGNFSLFYLMTLMTNKTKCLQPRLTPAYFAMIGLYATWFIRLGEGPLWKYRISLEQERCQASWWKNILYINNYYGNDQLCMFQSWYLASKF